MAVIVRLLPLWVQAKQRCASLPASLEALPKQAQLLILVGGVYLFFGIHNFLQEALMNQPGFSHLGVMLGYFEVLD